MNTKWYTGTQADVQAYVDALNENGLLPIVVGTYRMEKWCEDATLCTDGQYACPQPPDALLEHHGVTAGTVTAIKTAYVDGKLTLHDEQPDIPVIEE